MSNPMIWTALGEDSYKPKQWANLTRGLLVCMKKAKVLSYELKVFAGRKVQIIGLVTCSGEGVQSLYGLNHLHIHFCMK